MYSTPVAVRPYREECRADSWEASGIGSANWGVVRGADGESICWGVGGV